MDSTDCFLEILSAYQSSDSGCQVSLLEYCHRFGVDYYKFLGRSEERFSRNAETDLWLLPRMPSSA